MGTEVAVVGCAELTSSLAMPMTGSVVFFFSLAAAAGAVLAALLPLSDDEAHAVITNTAHTASGEITAPGFRMIGGW
jgi:type IV secretory pathway component VirB8